MKDKPVTIEHTFEMLKKAACIGVCLAKEDKPLVEEHLKELGSLANTLGLEPIFQIVVPIKQFDSATYIGSGKVQELSEKMEQEGIDVIIFDDEITPNQQKNLEQVFKKPVIDRTELILEIFASRAQTKEAHLQIELAQIKYQLPRLKRMWTHLSRQRTGGSGYLKGEGEKQIEIDRRILKAKITRLEKELKEVRAIRETQRQQRKKTKIPTFAIVGYTNAGKSTLLNALTDAGVITEDKLFCTLDTTTRKFSLPNHQSVLLVDTVGFIRKLPHTLVEAFKSTLEEVCYTDILIHVLDVSHPMVKEHAEATMQVLKELKADKKPQIVVLNKIDALHNPMLVTRYRMEFQKSIGISAKEKKGFDDLLEMMMKEIKALRKIFKIKIPQSEYGLIAELSKQGQVLKSEYEENDILLEIEIPKELEHKLQPYQVTDEETAETRSASDFWNH
jgi:GTP-binding protein HflX